MVGETINQYEFLAELGKGGMGVVYKARDLRLDRFVAIKILPSDKTSDADRRRRFITEARAASALNHPNIVTIHEIGRHGETDFIVMEYVDGKTLDTLIPPRGLRLDETLRYAVQIAGALAAAHAAGIVHRDLKPGNVMATPAGRIIVLDFGLAKLTSNALDRAEAQETLTLAIRDDYFTSDRHVLGTAPYMSPEQAEGKPVDFRSDVFSFGSLLYEMLTGQRAFQAESVAGTMAAVLRDEPAPLGDAAVAVPAEVARIVNRCLRKDPARRFQHMDDLMLELEDLKTQSDSGNLAPVSAPAGSPAATRRSRWWWLAPVSVLFGIFGWLAGQASRFPEQIVPVPSSLVRFAGGGETVSPSWSPDGEWIVYTSDQDGSRDIWKRPYGGGEAIRLTESPQNEWAPAWSPDGRSIAFASDAEGGGIFHVPASGGSVTRLASLGSRPVWSPDGRSIAVEWLGDIYVVPVPDDGGEPEPLVRGTGGSPYIAWAPDGRNIAFWHETKVDLFVASVATGEIRPLGLVPTGEEIAGLSWSSDGRWLVYSQGPFGGNKNLWRTRVDPGTGAPQDAPARLTLSATDDAECAISPDGKRIAYDVRRLERHLWQLNRNPSTGRTAGPARQVTQSGQLNYYPAVSPDGRYLVWTSHATGRGQLYYRELAGGKTQKLTSDWNSSIREILASFDSASQQLFYTSTLTGSYQIWKLPTIGGVSLQISNATEPARDVAPVLSPDGQRVAYYGNKAGNWDIWLLDTANGSEPRQLTDWPGNDTYPVFAPRSGTLAFQSDRNGSPDIWRYDFATEEFQPLVTGPAEESWCAWSPDERFFYFTSNRGGAFELWMMPAAGGEPVRVETFTAPAMRLPQSNKLYTKFALTDTSLIVPLETSRSDIYLLELNDPPS